MAHHKDEIAAIYPNALPAITTLRGQIDGRYWFPAYSQANDVLRFSSGDVQIDEVVKLTNYKAIANSKWPAALSRNGLVALLNCH